MVIQPLFERVLVRRAPAEEKVGMIFVPDNAKEKPLRGTIVAAGPGYILEDGSRRPMSVKQGDEVIIGKYAGTDVEVDGETLLMISENDVLGIVHAGEAASATAE